MIIFVLCIQKIKKILCLTSINPLKPLKKRFFKFFPKKSFWFGKVVTFIRQKNSSLQDKLESRKKKIITLRESIKKALMKRLLNIILNISPIRKIENLFSANLSQLIMILVKFFFADIFLLFLRENHCFLFFFIKIV